MQLNPEIFKAYDVRGAVPEDFDAEGAGRIARAYFAYLTGEGAPSQPVVVLARDARPSSDGIADAVRDALVAQGASVLDLGYSTTPMFYFGVNHLDADGGIMVTASHNPPPDNGLKMVRRRAVAIGAGQGMEAIAELALKGDVPDAQTPGSAAEVSVRSAYADFLAAQVSISRSLSVVIDAGNGMASVVLDALLPKLPQLTVEKLYFEVDLTFPNHEANPVKEETLEELKRVVRAKGADIGIAFDGDADRVGFITAEGETVRCDTITALLAAAILDRSGKNETIGFEVKSSRAVEEVVREHGGTPKRIKTGHAAANQMLRECDGALSGELSCHFYFRETAYRDAAVLAMLKVLELVSQQGALADIVAPIASRYVQSGEINFHVAEKDRIIADIAKTFSDGKASDLDGLTVEYPDWWFNVRASNTEDLLRLNVEAKTKELMEEKLAQLTALIEGKTT